MLPRTKSVPSFGHRRACVPVSSPAASIVGGVVADAVDVDVDRIVAIAGLPGRHEMPVPIGDIRVRIGTSRRGRCSRNRSGHARLRRLRVRRERVEANPACEPSAYQFVEQVALAAIPTRQPDPGPTSAPGLRGGAAWLSRNLDVVVQAEREALSSSPPRTSRRCGGFRDGLRGYRSRCRWPATRPPDSPAPARTCTRPPSLRCTATGSPPCSARGRRS